MGASPGDSCNDCYMAWTREKTKEANVRFLRHRAPCIAAKSFRIVTGGGEQRGSAVDAHAVGWLAQTRADNLGEEIEDTEQHTSISCSRDWIRRARVRSARFAAAMGTSRTPPERRAAQASIKGRRVGYPSRFRSAAGAVTRSALIWLIAQVLPCVASHFGHLLLRRCRWLEHQDHHHQVLK